MLFEAELRVHMEVSAPRNKLALHFLVNPLVPVHVNSPPTS